MNRNRVFAHLAVAILVSLLLPALSAAADQKTAEEADPAFAPQCALLDDSSKRGRMDGLLRWLLIKCGREDELGSVRQDVALPTVPGAGPGAMDVQVNDSTGDVGASTTQSETSISINEVTGTYCSGYNDSAGAGGSFSGFSRSTDGGASWEDRGSLPNGSSGDPSIVWRRQDEKFYYASLRSGGLAIWRSDDDCQTFTFVAQVVTGSDDKELIAIENSPASPYYGRIYMVWTDFGAGAQIFSTFSDDGGATWSPQLALSAVGADVQGAWPTVAANGDLYVGWVRWNPFPSGPIDIEIVRSTDGGASFASVPNPVTGEVNPRDSTATSNCGRPALNGNIRYLPSPQLVVGPDGALHVVYSYDPDGFDVGDVIDVFYRKYSSANGGAPAWGPEVKLNDDGGLNDQYFPTLSVSPENIVVVTFYDRRLDDPANLLQDTFKTVSPDGGTSWLANERVSDVSTPIYLDPGLATCYHGDYDQVAQDTGFALLQWSDDRNIQNGHNDPDVWFESAPLSNDFIVIAAPSNQSTCAPAEAEYAIEVLQFQGFSEPITLDATGNPAGTSVTFSQNPVNPPGSSILTIGNTGAAAGVFDADPGSYSIAISGTSDPSAITRETSVGLDLFTAMPQAPVLTAPADGEQNVESRPTFEWQEVMQAASYTIEIASDANFNNIVDAATGLTEATYTAAILLDTNSLYYWRVRADNACGESTDSPVWSFKTEPAPGDCSEAGTQVSEYFDDFESGAGGWIHSAGEGPDTWTLSGARTTSGVNAWYAENVSQVSDQYLVSPTIELPSTGGPLTLQFQNYQQIEDSPTGCYDGAVLEVSSNNGVTWTRLETELLTDPYDGAVSTGFSNPIAGDNAWCGAPQDWLNSIVDMDDWAGQTVQFRFRLATDSLVSREGWYIDDVEVQSCRGVFSDDFESGGTENWSETQN